MGERAAELPGNTVREASAGSFVGAKRKGAFRVRAIVKGRDPASTKEAKRNVGTMHRSEGCNNAVGC